MGYLILKTKTTMKLLIITCLVAVSMGIVCDNPMLNSTRNRLAPKTGILTESEKAPEKLPVCKPLQGKDVCCKDSAWDELQENFERIKDKFGKFVKRRKERIEKIEKDLKEDLVDEVSEILNRNDAMINSKAYQMEIGMLRAQGKKTKEGKDLKFNPIKRRKFDHKGHEVCDQ